MNWTHACAWSKDRVDNMSVHTELPETANGGTTERCRFCGRSCSKAGQHYLECARCGVLISDAPPGDYDEAYYYSRRMRGRLAKRRAKRLISLFWPWLHPGKCLDFGCNDGSFVEALNRRGGDCDGVEINESMVAAAREQGERVFRPDELKGNYKILTAFDVLEHFDDPAGFFSRAQGRIERDGLLIITTPNAGSKWRKIFGESWHGFGIPQYHRLIFGRAFLEKALLDNGYEPVRLFSRPPIGPGGWRLLLASGYRLQSGYGKKALALPGAALKLAAGKTIVGGEEDTLCAVARKVKA